MVRDAKVGNLDDRVISAPEQVGRLDVAVDDALVMDCEQWRSGGASCQSM
jgi:hypothetical protein